MRIGRRWKTIGAAVAALTWASGCYGGKTQVVAPTSNVPVSLSRAVRDADGHLVKLDEREIVGQFSHDVQVYSMFYGVADLDPTTDISEAVNRQVAEHGGEAVTSLEISATPCGWGVAFPFNWLPFWPGCANVAIRGDIIRRRPERASPPVAHGHD